jgi:hypothetical protein
MICAVRSLRQNRKPHQDFELCPQVLDCFLEFLSDKVVIISYNWSPLRSMPMGMSCLGLVSVYWRPSKIEQLGDSFVGLPC